MFLESSSMSPSSSEREESGEGDVCGARGGRG